MEGSQGGCAPTYQGVRSFPAEKMGAQPSRRIVASIPYSGWKMGEYFHEIHHQSTYGSG